MRIALRLDVKTRHMTPCNCGSCNPDGSCVQVNIMYVGGGQEHFVTYCWGQSDRIALEAAESFCTRRGWQVISRDLPTDEFYGIICP